MNNLLRVLSIRSFLSLWLSEIFAQIAMNMANFILLILAFKYTNSNTAVSGIVIAFTLPAIIFGLVAGVYVDRWNKKTVLHATNILRAAIIILPMFLTRNLFVMYLVTFLSSIITQFFIPAETPMIPLIVEKRLLMPANALFGIGIYGSMLTAYAFSGPVLLYFGEKNAFLFLSILYFIASFFVSFIKLSKRDKKVLYQVPHVIGEIKDAFSLIAKTKRISNSLFLLTLSSLIILTLSVIGPGYAKQILNISVEDFPVVFVAPAALGMVMVGIFLSNTKSEWFRENCALFGVFLSSIGLLALPFAKIFTTFLAFVLGASNALVFIPSNTLLQEETSDEFRGKIYGFLNSLIGAVSLLPIVIVGGLADIFGIIQVIIGISAALFIIGVYLLVTK